MLFNVKKQRLPSYFFRINFTASKVASKVQFFLFNSSLVFNNFINKDSLTILGCYQIILAAIIFKWL